MLPSLLAQLPEDRVALTVKLETEFQRPAPLGELHAKAWLMTRDGNFQPRNTPVPQAPRVRLETAFKF